MQVVPEVPGDPSRLSNLRRLFGRREDAYAGADQTRARRIGGYLWIATAVFGMFLMYLSPPDRSALEVWGWPVAGLLLLGTLAAGHGLLRRGLAVGNNELYAISFAALAMNGMMEFLAGGRNTPWHSFYLIIVLFTAAIHPPRRAGAFLGAYILATWATAFHSGGWTRAETGEVLLEVLVTCAIALLTIVVMDGVRTQRLTLEQEGDEARHLANVDALTGLGNRRKLMTELESAEPTPERPLSLALYDLDGFKSYNDSFGHVAGDALLVRIAERLAAAVGSRGHAYRMGGDEFCVTTRLAGDEAAELIDTACAALAERGEGFHIHASHGWTQVTDSETSSSEILRAADRGMYARKTLSRASAGRQSTDVLLSALAERSADLGEHVHDVRDLCASVADELELLPEEKAPLLQAASLHDVGKVAIPDAILNKPGPLNDEEWEFMRRHTIVGERILSAAPALVEAAKIVRSTHERFDGWGYPDGLTAERIPLGARVIAVCDAFDAMVSPRPYRVKVTPEQAVEELRRCAGAQFDPRVVEAFCAVYVRRTQPDGVALTS
ncbi:MAG: diguanylate cyclase [Actinomycetota bacterium]|nr:diguanylate cyclase [Actinomycetota bacterium]